jgi:rare lipoprotein A
VADSPDPVWRATATAARLNQLHRDSVDASDIKITWDNDRRSYVIKANEVEVIVCNADTVLPDTIESGAGDLLQATNRIRRQMGNAQPLSGIEGDPNGFNQVSIGPISLRISGYASWYGPGFDGAYSASGERFNAEALTAAHPSLPFGTQIRVTNMDNGESVVVRVNDRGPYAHDRVIDLSTGAARVIGLIQAGVAPVKLEVLGVVQAASN